MHWNVKSPETGAIQVIDNDEDAASYKEAGYIVTLAEGTQQEQAVPNKPSGATAADVAKFAVAPMTSIYFDVMGNPISKEYWEKNGIVKGLAKASGALVPAVGDAALNMSMFSGVGTAPAAAAKTALAGAGLARKAGGGLLADLASGTVANIPKLTQKSLSGISNNKITGEFLKNRMSAKDLATIGNYDKSINSLKTKVANLEKQFPKIKQGNTPTAEELAKIEDLNTKITPLQRNLKAFEAERSQYVDKVANTIGSAVESQIQHTPFISGMAGVAGGAAQRGAYKDFGDKFSEDFGLEGKNMYERIMNRINYNDILQKEDPSRKFADDSINAIAKARR